MHGKVCLLLLMTVMIGRGLAEDDYFEIYPEITTNPSKDAMIDSDTDSSDHMAMIPKNSNRHPSVRSDDEETDPAVLNAGGYKVSIEKYPYMASISFDGEVSCSGVLVDSRHILTSYLCFNDTGNSNPLSTILETSVRIGSDYFDKMGKANKLKWIYDHPMVMAGNIDHYGFVLAEFEKPLPVEIDSDYDAAEFSDLHDPWHMRTTTLLNEEMICGLVGFGRNRVGSNHYAGALHFIPFKLMKPSECKEAGVAVQPEFELCAAAPVYRENACLEEVGAPLICYGKVYGILGSRDGTCGVRLDRPTLFLRADQAGDFMTLIRDCVDSNDCYKTRSEPTTEET